MYDSIIRGELDAGDSASVGHHQGTRQDFLVRHQKDALRAASQGIGEVRKLASSLHARIADSRTMRLAWDALARQGGQAPGPNGRRYSDYSSIEVWELCGCLAHAVRDETYRPGPARIIRIAKSSGGTRPLVLMNIADRVVQRAVMMILQPLLDPLFDARSFGYRPLRGHLHALALGEYFANKEQRRVWITQDIRDAFQHIPVQRLLQVLFKFLPDDKLRSLLKHIFEIPNVKGLPQGGPLSPLMLNVYLHHHLDRPWRRKYPDLPMVRMADDILVACSTVKQAKKAHANLAEMLLPSGMPLKFSKEQAIHDLGQGAVVSWLGFDLSMPSKRLKIQSGDKAWARLEEHLEFAHTKSDSPNRALRTIQQWLSQRGPCFHWSDTEADCEQVIAIACQHGFEEVPPVKELQEKWKLAQRRWRSLRKVVRADDAQAQQDRQAC